MTSTHTIIHLNSKSRSRGSTNAPEYFLQHATIFNQKFKNKKYFARLENILIPKTFYEINANNNTFIVSEQGGGNNSVSIDNGNYTVSELLTELTSALNAGTTNGNTFVLSYDTNNGKISLYFTGTSTDITINTIASGSIMNEVIGYGKAITDDNSINILSGSGNVEEGSYVVNLAATSTLEIDTNLSSDNTYTRQDIRNVLAMVPMNVDRYEYKLFENHNGPMIKLASKSAIHRVRFNIVDAGGNDVDLNGADWSCDLCIYEVLRTPGQ